MSSERWYQLTGKRKIYDMATGLKSPLIPVRESMGNKRNKRVDEEEDAQITEIERKERKKEEGEGEKKGRERRERER